MTRSFASFILTNTIRAVREHCSACNRSAPSQAATPAIPSPVPSTPFESIFNDFFLLWWLSLSCGWRPTLRMGRDLQSSSWDSTSRCSGLIAALIALFDMFCVPEKLSSDGGPEFSSAGTAEFLTRWEVRRRMSSAYFLQSNGRAEEAIKTAKRMLMDNAVDPNGSLNNDGLLRALLQACNTPDPDAKKITSPAQVVFYRPIRHAFSLCVVLQCPYDDYHLERLKYNIDYVQKEFLQCSCRK